MGREAYYLQRLYFLPNIKQLTTKVLSKLPSMMIVSCPDFNVCCFVRFLKSDVYKDCIRAEMSGSQTTSSVSQLNLIAPDTNR